jgi:hypothetical protein
VAVGDSEVRVYDLAMGGAAILPFLAGGHATSQALGTNAGQSTVEVHSLAIHGAGGARPGMTSAEAVGRGLGAVFATATADASATSDASHARAEAVGSSGGAKAAALSGGGRFASTSAIVLTPIVGSGLAEASADATGVLPAAGLDGYTDGYAFVTATGERPEVWGRAALGLLDRQGLTGDDLLLRSEATFEQALLNMGTASSLFVSFLSVEAGSAGFDELRFLIRNGETALVDEVFGEVDDAVEFFQDKQFAFVLGPGVVPLDLHFVMELDSGGVGSGFSATFALGTIPIPEPSTGSLLLVGLVLLAVRRPRRRSSRIY